jgi:hypothetical protein
MGCGDMNCGDGGVPLCYLKTYVGPNDIGSENWESAVNLMALPWTFVDQYGSGVTYTITSSDVTNKDTSYCSCPEGVIPSSACDENADLDDDPTTGDNGCYWTEDTTPYWAIDFSNKWTDDTVPVPSKLWEIGPCQDGEGVFCVGDGYCETSCGSDENCLTYDGDNTLGVYESYLNSPDDCDMHYVLDLEISSIAEPHSLKALGAWMGGNENECRDSDWEWNSLWNWYDWEHPDYAFNPQTTAESVCPSGFEKIYWTNFKTTKLFNGIGDLFADGDVATLTQFGGEEAWTQFQDSYHAGNADQKYTNYLISDGLLSATTGVLNVPNMFGFNTYYLVDTWTSDGLTGDVGGSHCGGWVMGDDYNLQLAHYTIMSTGINFKSLNPESVFDMGQAGFQSCNDAIIDGVGAGSCRLKAIGTGMTWTGDENNLWYTIGLEEGDGEWEPTSWDDCGNLGDIDMNMDISGPWDEDCHTTIPQSFNWDGVFDGDSAFTDLDNIHKWSPKNSADITDAVYTYSSADSEYLTDNNLVNRWYCCTDNVDRNRENTVLGCMATISA